MWAAVELLLQIDVEFDFSAPLQTKQANSGDVFEDAWDGRIQNTKKKNARAMNFKELRSEIDLLWQQWWDFHSISVVMAKLQMRCVQKWEELKESRQPKHTGLNTDLTELSLSY